MSKKRISLSYVETSPDDGVYEGKYIFFRDLIDIRDGCIFYKPRLLIEFAEYSKYVGYNETTSHCSWKENYIRYYLMGLDDDQEENQP